MRISIQYEDKHIIVIYKPAGLATQTAKIGQPDVVSELKNHLKGGYVGVVHRLDQPVEGLLVFGKTKEATAALSAQLSQGILNKHYQAVICGQPQAMEGTLVDYLIKTPDNRAQVVEMLAGRDITAGNCKGNGKDKARDNAPKKAVLNYRIVRNSSENVFLADIHIETGRFHQIRVQMAHAGMPLLGDAKYGTEQSGELSRKLGVRTVALCACEIVLKHPVSGEELSFQTEPKGTIFG